MQQVWRLAACRGARPCSFEGGPPAAPVTRGEGRAGRAASEWSLGPAASVSRGHFVAELRLRFLPSESACLILPKLEREDAGTVFRLGVALGRAWLPGGRVGPS